MRMWLWILLLLLLVAPAGAVTCTVTSTADSGAGSFRQAVADANAASCDTIDFNIAGAGVHTIALGSQLLVTAANVTIDGSTQSGSSRGDLWGGTPPVWNIAVTGHPINFDTTATGGVLIGVDISATAAGEAAVGAGASGVTIKACYLHGAANQGINISADSVTIGGVSPGDGNVISGNTTEGMAVLAHTGLVVQGNFICADKTGMTAEPNTIGVNLEGAASATIGGLGTAKNLISGCSASNVQAANGVGGDAAVWAHDGVVQYNLIGTDKTGLAPIAGATPGYGVILTVVNAQPTPGPATPGVDNFNIHHNTVSANAIGVAVGQASFTSVNNTTVAFNNIGTDVNGAQAVGLCNLTADLQNFGTVSDIHDNNLCTFTPTPTPVPTGCGAISTNPSGLTCIDAAMETGSGTDCTTLPGGPAQGSQACCNAVAGSQSYCTGDTGTTCSVDSDCAGGATGPCVIVTCTFTAGGACSPATFPEGAIGGACVAGATLTPTATGPTPTPTACDIGSVTLQYIGSNDPAVFDVDATGIPVTITHSYPVTGITSGDVLTSPSENGTTLDATAHSATRIGATLTIDIFGASVTKDILNTRRVGGCVWVNGDAAPLDVTSPNNSPPVLCRPSPDWQIVNFACATPSTEATRKHGFSGGAVVNVQ